MPLLPRETPGSVPMLSLTHYRHVILAPIQDGRTPILEGQRTTDSGGKRSLGSLKVLAEPTAERGEIADLGPTLSHFI